ncbi:hypothetical protein AYL99_09360 [Fonsecaea erecta]|uniref:Uncharacterized protein n=1 Tax=Fonsecaea erecta TaxID=1367422 RepID=A0A178Z9P6_9EURO|nr:hypothetical protein AYL99_09360 [Fonsecaea erecta]OAP56181.1 hypothetical protein AYL99_09360 [Fonsecaea erecta]
MQFLSTGKLVALLGAVGALPLVACHDLTARQVEDISTAQNNWAADTGVVSTFLSNAVTFSGADLVAQAQNALDHENDELKHKAALDAVFLNVANPNSLVVQANNVLVNQGTFESVVSNLQNFVTFGADFDAEEIAGLVGDINNVRCAQVLPAIDQYFQAVGDVLQNGIDVLAVRPTNCPSGTKKRSEL